MIGSGPTAVNVSVATGAAGADVAGPDPETTVVFAADAVTTSSAADSISVTGDADGAATVSNRTEPNNIKT